MRRRVVLAVASGALVVSAVGAAVAGGGSIPESTSTQRPGFAQQPTATGVDRAVEVLTALLAENSQATGLSTALEHLATAGDVTIQGASGPGFAGRPASTGLARAGEVLAELQADHAEAQGLSSASQHVSENGAVHPTGRGH